MVGSRYRISITYYEIAHFYLNSRENHAPAPAEKRFVCKTHVADYCTTLDWEMTRYRQTKRCAIHKPQCVLSCRTISLVSLVISPIVQRDLVLWMDPWTRSKCYSFIRARRGNLSVLSSTSSLAILCSWLSAKKWRELHIIKYNVFARISVDDSFWFLF